MPMVYDVQAQDAEDSELSFSLLAGPSRASIDSRNGRLSWTPRTTDVGAVSFTISIDDSDGARYLHSFTVNVAQEKPDALPLLLKLPRVRATLHEVYSSKISGIDRIGRPVDWSLAQGPDTMRVDTQGEIRWTPSARELGSIPVQLIANLADGSTQSVPLFIDVTTSKVNSAPQFSTSPAKAALVEKSYRYQATAVDNDGDAISYSLTDAPTGMSIHPDLGWIEWTPAQDQLGVHTVTVQAIDRMGGTTIQSYSLRVGKTIGPPILTSTQPLKPLSVKATCIQFDRGTAGQASNVSTLGLTDRYDHH